MHSWGSGWVYVKGCKRKRNILRRSLKLNQIYLTKWAKTKFLWVSTLFLLKVESKMLETPCLQNLCRGVLSLRKRVADVSNDISIGFIWIRGNSGFSPLNFAAKIVALVTLFLTESLEPLQRLGGFIFQRRGMRTPIFNRRMCGCKLWIYFKYVIDILRELVILNVIKIINDEA